jgi:small-conductance mechanosensitive channel
MNNTSHANIKFELVLAALLIMTALLGLSTRVSAEPAYQETPIPTVIASQPPTPLPGVPIVLGDKTLFYVYERIGPLIPAERAGLIEKKIQQLANDPFAPSLEITLVESDQGIDLMTGDVLLMTVTQADAAAVGMSQHDTAQAAAQAIEKTVQEYRLQNTPKERMNRILITMGILLILFLPLYFLNRLIQRRLDAMEQTLAENGKEESSQRGFFRTDLWRRSVRLLFKSARAILILVFIFFVSPSLLRLFPSTFGIAQRIIDSLSGMLSSVWTWFGEYQSGLLTILVIVLVTYGLTRLIHGIFREVEQGTIRFGNFDPEWAPFTRRILNFLLIIGAAIVAFPYIPGSDSQAFRGISVFLGLLFTLSSTAAVANIVAGVTQTYTGAFRVGDVVRIGETMGTVIEKRLLTTRLRTFKQEEVSIPNSLVMNAQVMNYSVLAGGGGVVLYTTVTIGYDVPWRKVHELLICAAENTEDMLKDPPPFVLQTSLNDYSVAYQLNAYTKRPEIMPRLYDALHKNIQDEFNKAGVEIMSPAFTALRDGNTITIPADNRPPDYQTPGFRIDSNK